MIILIDIFILINVFIGLDDIGNWYISPSQAYPCYAEWQSYRTKTTPNKDYEIIEQTLQSGRDSQRKFQQLAQTEAQDHLGQVSATCLQYAGYQDQINTPENQKTLRTIEQRQTNIATLEQSNRTIRSQYGSTLLERIAGQPQERSINNVSAEKAKETLDQNNSRIAALKREIATLQSELVAKPESTGFLTFLKENERFNEVDRGYRQASFWYPSIQLVFQALFLVPLILAALLVQKFAERRRYGLVSLISWHLLVIFLIPLVIKVFEFLQVGVLFQFLFDIIKAIFGGLLFLVSYLYILLIPLVGFFIIKFFQKVVLNQKLQAANRVQQGRCINCARRLRNMDKYCPYCGEHQYDQCVNCNGLTHRYLPYCKHCGHSHSA